MPLHMEPGQVYNTWAEFKEALDNHCLTNRVIFNISNAKTVEQANNLLKKKPYFDIRLKYASCMLVCKHFGSYKSLSAGLRPKQRSYKINCKAFISVSACRKENYLIIRDSYHIHSHPCSEEIFNSYPEVRRMTKEERNMVGTLMDLGVPTSQIKTAVGRNVTPKDLQNAKSYIKAVKLGLKAEEPGPRVRKRRTYKMMEAERREARRAAGEIVSDSDEDKDHAEGSSSSSSSHKLDGEKLQNQGEISSAGDADNSGYTVTIGDITGQLEVGPDSITEVEAEIEEKKEGGATDTVGLSGLLAAAGLSSDSVVLTVNNQGHLGEGEEEGVKNSYTVTVSLPDGEVTQTGTNLQELLKGLPLGKIIPKSPSPLKVKTEQEESPVPVSKQCTKCGGYISPLDGHYQCLSCLGPEHIHEQDCEHCKAMTPEQFNIRRKKMVALRMKALKEMRRKRKHEDEQSDEQGDSDIDYMSGVRKSRRVRKPKQYGPDIAVENSFVLGGSSPSKSPRASISNLSNLKLAMEDMSGHVTKTEPLDDYDSSFSSDEILDDRVDSKAPRSRNSQRFDHILSQTTVFEDVQLTEGSSRQLCFTPEMSTVAEFQKVMSKQDPSAVPPTLIGKYNLQPKFEAMFCSEPPPLLDVRDPSTQVMGAGLSKLAKNAAAQTRMAVYDKLFTRLGVGMADEALTILSELYGKVTEVTEISQEDLTNSLQTALDTIQALKDVLEELGIISKDAITTAAHQRSLSINSLNAARKSLKVSRVPFDESTPRRGKFLPFSRAKVSPRASATEQSSSLSSSTSTVVSSTISSLPSDLKQLSSTVTSAQLEGMSEVPIMAIAATNQEIGDSSTETSTAFINMSGKEFTMAPLTVSGELLQSLTNSKDGIIELHVMKEGTDLMDTEEATVEEVIHTE